MATVPVPTGVIGRRRLPQIDTTSLHGTFPSPATLKMPGMRLRSTNSIERIDVVFLGELHQRIEAGIDGTSGISSACDSAVVMSVPSTLENRSRITTTCGLSSAKSRR